MDDSERSWFDITIEEEEEKGITHEQPDQCLSNSFTSESNKRSFPTLSPLKEADRDLEIEEELSTDTRGRARALFISPERTKLGPRASQRHSNCVDDEIDGLPMESSSPLTTSARGRRRVKVTMTEAPPFDEDGSLLSRDVKSRLGPRAASRHSPHQVGSKRQIVRESPRRDSDHRDKRFRISTPTRDSHTPTRSSASPSRQTPIRGSDCTPTRNQTSNKNQTPSSRRTPQRGNNQREDDIVPITNGFSTPEPARKPKSEHCKTPNSDSRVYNARKQNSRTRGKSESSKENEPVRQLTKEQIAQREKQVTYGKVTEGYQNYKAVIPKSMRNIRDPATPIKDYPYSKRCWDGLVRSWRRKLHDWDDPKKGLELRAAYTKNNSDLKSCGLISETGEVVCCLSGDLKSTDNSSTAAPVSKSTPATTNQSPTVKTETTDHLTSEWNIPDFIYPEEDDACSVDSEYTRLLGNQDDFPDEDDSDESYRFSQDSYPDDMDGEVMSCDDEEVAGNIDQTSGIAV